MTAGVPYNIRKADDLMRLPVWARSQVKDLLAEVHNLRSTQLGTYEAEHSEAYATIGHSVHYKVVVPLGRRVQVDWYDNWNVRYSKDDGGLLVTTHGGPMLVAPQISNQVVIRTINAGLSS